MDKRDKEEMSLPCCVKEGLSATSHQKKKTVRRDKPPLSHSGIVV